MPTEKLKAIRVELIEWELTDSETLVMLFKRVLPYLCSTDFTQAVPKTTIFTDFGYLKLTLKSQQVGHLEKDSWLSEYINDDQVFIEEENENELTFWEGEEESRYDWMSGYSITFDSKQVEQLNISTEEWKAKCLDMALKWKRESNFNDPAFKEWYTFFFSVYKKAVQKQVKAILSNPIANELLDSYESNLNTSLDAWFADPKNEITFWPVTEGHDWTASYAADINKQLNEDSNLTNDEWKTKYHKITQDWKTELDANQAEYEHWYALFFLIYKRVVQNKINSIRPKSKYLQTPDILETSLWISLTACLAEVKKAKRALKPKN